MKMSGKGPDSLDESDNGHAIYRFQDGGLRGCHLGTSDTLDDHTGNPFTQSIDERGSMRIAGCFACRHEDALQTRTPRSDVATKSTSRMTSAMSGFSSLSWFTAWVGVSLELNSNR